MRLGSQRQLAEGIDSWGFPGSTWRTGGSWRTHVSLRTIIVLGLASVQLSTACIIGAATTPTPIPPPTSTRLPFATTVGTPKPEVRLLPTLDVAATHVAAIRASIIGTPTPKATPNLTPIFAVTPTLRPPGSTRVPTPTKKSPLSVGIPRTISISYAGRRDLIVGPIDLAEGVVVLRATHSGQEGFSVLIFGETVGDALLIDTVGAYAGDRGTSVSLRNRTGLVPGPHRLLVKADGLWTLRVGQEFPLDGNAGSAPPFRLSEQRGDLVKRWIRLPEGEFLVRSSHLGNGKFVVSLINADGGDEVLVVDQTGVFEGERLLRVGPASSRVDLTPGFYALVVQADGAWEIDFQP